MASWTQSGFDDTAWLSGQTGIGYEKGPPNMLSYTGLINLDVEEENDEKSCVKGRLVIGAQRIVKNSLSP